MAGHGSAEWASETGDRWRENLDQFEGMIAAIGTALIDHAGFAAGEFVADVGCGAGPTTLEVARRVGPEGRVTGLDIAPQLVAVAQDRAAAAGLANVAFQTLDCERGTPPGTPFDRLFSRFGVMFFDDSTAAFANMRGWLKPGGRLDFAAWGLPAENPWFAQVGAIMARHFDLPAPEPDGPGPFRLGDPAATTAMLERAGFRDVSVARHEAEQSFAGPGSTPDSAVAFVLRAMDLQSLLDTVDEAAQAAVLADIRAVFAAHARAEGVMMPGCSLFYSARA